MAELRYAEIRFKDRVAGNLIETPDGGTVFEYSQQCDEAIACALPRDQDRHVWDTGLHPFFEHLGPEGWLRNRQARTAEITVEDDFGLLLEYGADCIGAVSVHDSAGGELNTDNRILDRLTQAAVQSKRTISGVQPKILVTRKGDRYFPAEQEDPAPYIAKFPSDDLPDLVSNEDFSLRLARIFLGSRRVTKAQRALVDGIETPALLVERFDRTANNEKLRLEDFAQILSQPKRRDFSGKYEGSFEQIADAIRSYSALPEIDIQLFFQMLIAFAVLGNCDCHLKNFSLLETRRGLRLVPAYDVVNTYIYGKVGYSTRFGLRLLGEEYQFDRLNRDIFSRFGRVIGLNPIAIDKSIDDIGAKQDKVLALIGPIAAVDQNGLFADYEQCVRDALVRVCGSDF
jgi:serine/threonine-protein kinase HipA